MNSYVDTYNQIAIKANFGQVEEASKWYLDAERVAHEVAKNLDADLETGASVVSAFSPRERWTNNVEKAVSFSLGKKVVGLPNNLAMAKKAIVLGFDALNGQKTNAFARAIAGDENAVVIDVWMLRALGIEKKTPSQSVYKEMARAVTAVAKLHNMTPRAMQALIWIVVRGSSQ
jgi:thermostable 8-oxoguanine DNA glycosylase